MITRINLFYCLCNLVNIQCDYIYNRKVGINFSIKTEEKGRMKKFTLRKNTGVTLVALVITILFSYDEKLKYSNNKGFLLATI
jgi:hypothetical protein